MMVFDQKEFFLLALVAFLIYLWTQRHKPLPHRIIRSIFFIYLAGVISKTLFPITLEWEWGVVDKINHIELRLFQYFVLREALLNVLMTIPFGLLYPWVWRHNWMKTIGLGLLFPVLIELSQLVLLLTTLDYNRVVDVSDVFFNFWGVILGYLIYRIIFRSSQRSDR